METVTVINQKGGVGKTVTAHALGAGLVARGKSVLYVDLDPQGNLSFALGSSGEKKNSFNLFMKNATAKECIARLPGGDCICASPNLAAVQTLLVNEIATEAILRDAFEEDALDRLYDYIIVDTPPALSLQTINALTASDKLVIPSQADLFGLQGIGQLFRTIEQVKKHYNPSLTVEGILLVRYKPRAALTKQVSALLEETASKLNTKVFRTRIRECIAIAEVQGLKSNIYAYSPRSNGAIDYNDFVNEFLGEQ